jgi:hypothetical protein
MTISPNKWELDVQGYLNVCNISAATPRQQIRDFAKGVNDLGLWNSMVCWPLRSSQNYGSGTTAFSLGGLGTFNGTLTNGPTWGSDGVVFDGTDDRIATNLVIQAGASGGVYTTTGGADRMIWSSRTGPNWTHGSSLLARENTDGNALVDIGGDANSRIRATGSPIFNQYAFTQATHTLAGTNTTANTTFRQNKNARSTGTYVVGSNENMGTSLENVTIGAAPAGSQLFSGTMSFVYISTVIYSSAQQESLYDLYKTTLGTGITLP